MRGFRFVFLHEIEKVFQDHRTFASLFFIPLLVVLISTFLSDSGRHIEQGKVYILSPLQGICSVSGYEHVYTTQSTIDELRESDILKSEDIVLKINSDDVSVYYHPENQVSTNTAKLYQSILPQMLLHDTSACLIPVTNESGSIMEEDTSVNLFSMMLVLLLYQSTSEYSANSITDEKSKGVFCRLLLTPQHPSSFIVGKMMAGIVCGIVSSMSYVLISLGVSYIVGDDILTRMSSFLKNGNMLIAILVTFLTVCMFASMTVCFALCAENEKQERAIRIPFYGIVMILALTATIYNEKLCIICYMIPVYSYCVVLKEMETPFADVIHMTLAMTSSVLIFFMFTYISIEFCMKKKVT